MREAKDRELRGLEERTLERIDELQVLDRRIESLQKAQKVEPGDGGFKAQQGLLPDEKNVLAMQPARGEPKFLSDQELVVRMNLELEGWAIEVVP